MLLGIEHLEGRQSLGDVFGGELLLSADGEVDLLRIHAFDHPLETNLLEVKDDLLHAFDNTGNGGELVVDAAHPDLGDGEAFERSEENAAECVADGLAVAWLQRAELKPAEGVGAFEHYHLIGLLKC